MSRKNFSELIGNTPLIRLNALSDMTGCEILGKAEFMNPGGSVKDRAAKAIIEAAEASGELKPGGLIVEGTAGNTGISLTLVGRSKGYRCVIVMPETQSQEKKDALRVVGADLRLVPAAPYRDPGNYVRTSERLADELRETEAGGVIWANQFDNTANKTGHFNTTGPEFWEQTHGQIDGFICAVGSGGTLAGTADYLRTKNKDIKIGLLEKEGLLLGGSSAINVAGAVKMAQKMGPGHTICTILCDSGQRYQSKIWNPDFLRSKNLPVPHWLET